MKREEAIMVLKEISATLKSWNSFTEYPQAIDMAIETLSADRFCPNCGADMMTKEREESEVEE